MIAFLAKFLGSGIIDRALDSVDKHIDGQTDRNRVKAQVIQTHLETRADFMNAGGKWLMLMFSVPLAFWFAAVVVYSIFWCQQCAYPQPWIIAALPPPLDEWAGAIIVSIYGVVGLKRLRR